MRSGVQTVWFGASCAAVRSYFWTVSLVFSAAGSSVRCDFFYPSQNGFRPIEVEREWKKANAPPRRTIKKSPCGGREDVANLSPLGNLFAARGMDVDSASSSPSSRLSVVCSASAEYSSNSSEGSSPNSRRNSMNETAMKDDHYWERRRKNNDASKRSREKRRLNDLAMEERIQALSAENERLKSQLVTRDTVLVTQPPAPLREFASLPSQSSTVLLAGPSKAMFPASAMSTMPSLTGSGLLPLLPSNSQLPMLQLCQFQAAMQQQLMPATPTTASPPCVFSSTSAFQPFRGKEQAPTAAATSVIMKAERSSPDSSSDVIDPNVQLAQRLPQPPQPSSSNSLLSALLATRRPSPAVPQSRTEHISGLNSPPRNSCSKSDCESISSSASLSPSHSSEDHADQLNGSFADKSPQYIDRRRRNNEAAKRCRANRRAVFEYRSRRVQLLEGENDELRRQIESLKQEVAQFKAILAQRAASHP
ncbi:unnamed protein product [Caenorhabditis auriculariae]|uniref:BZIP domain-containing protein n=1 Tax=Caenorhabditis auriculariae TaxID=2777116 RepID=A0A8S1HG67_9PELO|nr:unnamed protein product [Caenorhabditis auriculariae]